MPQKHDHDHQCPICDLTEEIIAALECSNLDPIQQLNALNNATQAVLFFLREPPEETAVDINDAQGEA